VHVKNVSWQRNEEGRWRWANDTLQGGMVDWPKVIVALRNSSYDGYLSVEDLYGVRLDTTGFAGEQFEFGTQDEVSIHNKLIDDFAFLTKCINA
jgi:sugar phosphate isomerase/epimerase